MIENLMNKYCPACVAKKLIYAIQSNSEHFIDLFLVALGVNDLDQYLSERDCPESTSQGNTEEVSDSSKSEAKLPMIDLFLNPAKQDELRKLQQWVEEREAESTYTEVKTIKPIPQSNYHRSPSLGFIPTFSGFSGIQCCLATQMTCPQMLICFANAYGRAMLLTALTSSAL